MFTKKIRKITETDWKQHFCTCQFFLWSTFLSRYLLYFFPGYVILDVEVVISFFDAYSTYVYVSVFMF